MQPIPSEIEPVGVSTQQARRLKARARSACDLDALTPREIRTQLLSVPVIFLALVRRLGLDFAAYPNRRDPGGWCFKFHRRFVLELDAAGRANWASVERGMRPRLEAALAQALQVHAVQRRSRPRRRLPSS